jgi:solute carrier family 35 (UDP-sugar transporter), member A1/2/3
LYFKILYFPNQVPALAYAIQTVLLYIGLEHLDAGTYSVTYQLKILTTAFFSVLLLKRRLSIVQWMSLFFLLAGVAIVQIVSGICMRHLALGLDIIWAKM